MTENNKTISQVVKDELCTGCGTCVALCPNEAIKLTLNEKKGIYIPQLNEEKCSNCGTCFKVCPGHSVDFKTLNLEIFGKEPKDILIGNYLNCYVGHSTDYNIRYNSASGGLVTQLLIFVLEEGIIDGALVTRMKKDNPLEPEPFIARTREEIIEASKSKYCPVPANIALKQILESKEGKKFAVVGLPCHIHGVRKAEQINKNLKEKIVLHLGIFCSNTPTFWATKFLFKKLNIREKDIKSISYRGKGWPGGMSIEIEDKTLFIPLFEYYDTGFGQYFSPIRCKLCIDQTCELADISFADAWFSDIMSKDKIGTSLVVLRKEHDTKILQNMLSTKRISIVETDAKKVLQSQGGYIFFRKSHLKARTFLINKKMIPNYNSDLLDPIFHTYLDYVLFRVGMFLASKPCLWRLLDFYVSSLKCISNLLHKLRGDSG
jgi:coenzyme F420 hydrogenase subunit beta